MQTDEVIVSIRNLNVSFEVHKYNYNTLKEYVMQALQKKRQTQTIKALSDISLDIRRGESVALIGHNGCGKSTLLKCIAGIIQPPGASVNVKGRIAPMIELGTGFDAELSGLENIYLSCTLMGLAKEEIESLRDDIIKFSELRNFIDVPLKNYSSGMQARLGFACATAINPDLLLVDEVLAVGDSNFATKCLNRIKDLQERGTTVILVSHDDATVKNFCDRAYVFNEGVMRFEGPVAEAIKRHREIMEERQLAVLNEEERSERLRLEKLRQDEAARNSGRTSAAPVITPFISFWQDDTTVEVVDTARPFEIRISLNCENPSAFNDDISIGIGVNHINGTRLGGHNTLAQGTVIPKALASKASRMEARFQFKRGIPILAAGQYRLVLGVHDNKISRTVYADSVGMLNCTNSSLGFNGDGDVISIRHFVEDIEVKL